MRTNRTSNFSCLMPSMYGPIRDAFVTTTLLITMLLLHCPSTAMAQARNQPQKQKRQQISRDPIVDISPIAHRPRRYRVKTITLVYYARRFSGWPYEIGLVWGNYGVSGVTGTSATKPSNLDYRVPAYSARTDYVEPDAKRPPNENIIVTEVQVPFATQSGTLRWDERTLKAGLRRTITNQSIRPLGRDWGSRFPGTVTDPQAPGEQVVQWEMNFPNWGDRRGISFEFDVEREIYCYDSKVNEQQALRIKRPAAWSLRLRPFLQPDRYLESDDDAIELLLERFTKGNHEKVTPYLLAKVILKSMLPICKNLENPTRRKFAPKPQPAGPRIGIDPRQSLNGLELRGAARFLSEQEGTEHDAVCLFVALCRAGGIPARPVVGFHVDKPDTPISWAEFFVPDLGWMPVDVMRFVRSPGFANKLDQAWPRFGSFENLNKRIPLAHRFEPTANAATTSGAPLLWGADPYIDLPLVQWTLWESHELGTKTGLGGR